MKKFVQCLFGIGLITLSFSAHTLYHYGLRSYERNEGDAFLKSFEILSGKFQEYQPKIEEYRKDKANAILKANSAVIAVISDLDPDSREELFSKVQKSPNLRELSLSGKSYQRHLYLLRAEGDNLGEFLKKSDKLHTLALPYIEFDHIPQRIFEKLPPTLQNLDLTGCYLLPDQAEPLLGNLKSTWLKSGPKLTSLVLSENILLYNKNAKDFFKSLPKTLKILKLRHCALSEDQAVALFKRLPFLKDLHTLDLSYNELSDLEPTVFRECFPQSLEQVDLSDCYITPEQSKILLETMSKLKNLQTIDLNRNKNIDCTQLKKLNRLAYLKELFIREVGSPEIRKHFSQDILIEVDREEKVLPKGNCDFLKPLVFYQLGGKCGVELVRWNFQKKSSGQKTGLPQ